MYESIRRFLHENSIEHWKLLVRKRDIVNAHFPAEPGQDNSSLQKKIQEEEYVLDLYREFHRTSRKFCGHTRVEWDGLTDQKEVEKMIVAAWEDALNQEDPWFPLEIPQSPSSQSSSSSFSRQELSEWILPLQESLVRATESKPYFLQNEFIRLEKEERVYLDSFQRELVEFIYCGTVDVSLLPRQNPEAHPRNGEIRFSEFTPHLMALYVQEKGELSCDDSAAQPLTPNGHYNVLLRGLLVAEFFQYLIRQLSGLSLYTGFSKNAPGKPLWNLESVSGDLLSVRALPSLYNSPSNSYFDDQGVILSPQTLVQDGVVKTILTSQETAHYLALPLTGMNNNFSVTPGSLDIASLASERSLEILRFRTFHLEESAGDFTAEVDFAYLYENGKRRPVFGFLLRGNLKQLLTNCRLSREIWTWENYEGPEFLQIPSEFLVGGS